jgi:diaminopropionate ammonia-lyase
MCRIFENPYRQEAPDWPSETVAAFESDDILALHQSLDEYEPTPLVALPSLARRLGVRRILVKDEAHRFGLKAFKALGATYAIYRFIRDRAASEGLPEPEAGSFYRSSSSIERNHFTFSTATDGNHGRGVAWAAGKLGRRAVIYMPKGTVASRIENIRREGAEVTVVDGNYDLAVSRMSSESDKHGWQIISDYAWPGYELIPRWIMAGYRTMFDEIHGAGTKRPEVDVVFIQGGAGALAGAAAWYYNRAPGAPRPRLVCVEPEEAACLYESMASPEGRPIAISGRQDSIMAGLNCGTPSSVSWPLLKTGADFLMTIPDSYAEKAVRAYYFASGDDQRIIAGESGAAGLGALLAVTAGPNSAENRARLGLTPEMTILLLNTEGDTDPDGFKRIIQSKPRSDSPDIA